MESFDSAFGKVELTKERKRHIFNFHPEVKAYQKQFAETLGKPKTIRRSRYDPKVVIFYSGIPTRKYLAIVVKTNKKSFVLTAYTTNKIKHLPL